MRLPLTSALLLLSLCAVGCGSGELGPAKPEDTPVVSEEEVKEKMMQGMPESAKKQMEIYKKGGTPH